MMDAIVSVIIFVNVIITAKLIKMYRDDSKYRK